MAVFTVIGEIKENKNQEFCEYIDSWLPEFNKIKRTAFHWYKNNLINEKEKPEQKTIQDLKLRFGDYTYRVYGSIMSEVKADYNSTLENKKDLINQITIKTDKLIEKRDKLETKINDTKNRLDDNELLTYDELIKFRKQKHSLYYLKNKINKNQNKIKNLEKEISSGDIKICFGKKKNLQTNKKEFIKQRDSGLFFVGRKKETQGNNNLQLFYDKRKNKFKIKLRKEIGLDKDKYTYAEIYLDKNNKKRIKQLLKDKTSPMTYHIIKKDNKYYLHITYSIAHIKEDCITRSNNGVYGVDLNKRFITVSETDKHGNLINKQTLNYRYGQGNKTTDDLRKLAIELTTLCKNTGKDLVIENLGFKKAKAKTTKRKSKYNKMVHDLPYRRFIDSVKSRCVKDRIFLHKVSPYNTSKIGDVKYRNKKKLTIHEAASYVIARRGMGFKDKIKK